MLLPICLAATSKGDQKDIHLAPGVCEATLVFYSASLLLATPVGQGPSYQNISKICPCCFVELEAMKFTCLALLWY